jgi:YegS/Rv2252/BmrU family lipid kinase
MPTIPDTPLPRQATLLVNRVAGRMRKEFDAGRVVRYLERRGVPCRLVEPSSPAEAQDAARDAAARGDSHLFVIGGDGTLRDAAAGLAGSATALAAVPGGTVNIWCLETGIPRSLRAAIDAHLSGQVVPVDLGRVAGQPFLLMASLGWDAAVVRSVSPRIKARLHDYAYVLSGALRLPQLRPRHITWRSGLARFDHDFILMVLSNTRVYGGRVQPRPGATACDGLLDLVVYCPKSPIAGLRLLRRTFARTLDDDLDAITDRVSEVTIETPGIPVQVDGDYLCETPVTITVDPGALLVSVPAGPLPAVLGGSRPD